MTTDKPNDDLDGQAEQLTDGPLETPNDLGAFRGVSVDPAASQPVQADAAPETDEGASELAPEEHVIEVGPKPLDEFIKSFVKTVRYKHGREGGSGRTEAEASAGTPDGLEDVIEIAEFHSRGKAGRIRRISAKPSVRSLIEKGLEGENLIDLIEHEVLAIIDSHKVLDDYEVVFLYDHTLINRTHASAVYQRLLDCDSAKNVLLVLKSPGGQVEPAYLISKLCRRKSKSKFLVCVPGEAKSAATLLSLGADEIHMGAMSELGPIDPQINEYPALAFSSALDKIAQLAEKYPGASDMLAKYLIGSGMDVQALGHYDRIAESYSQYAINLLDSKATETSEVPVSGRKNSAELAGYFTNHYKDHNFVIDVDEAIKQLGSEVVMLESDIYQACHEIHKFLEACEIALTLQKHPRRVSVLGNKFVLRKP